jgi:hypothetical protein
MALILLLFLLLLTSGESCQSDLSAPVAPRKVFNCFPYHRIHRR